jgi:CelD/BcsL family acetyltransferase involved in cellulose biosynthesis/GNAT superfamily N-acetyltransferase
MHVHILRTRDEISELTPAWDELAKGASASTPFITPAWTTAWLETTRELEPYVVTVSRGVTLVGLLPLVKTRAARRLGFVAEGEYALLAVGEVAAVADAIAMALAERTSDWDVIELAELRGDAADVLASAFDRHELGWHAKETSAAPFVRLDSAYSARPEVIDDLMRRECRLESVGPVRFQRATSAEELDVGISEVLQRQGQWLKRPGSVDLGQVARVAAAARAIPGAVDLLRVDEQLVAYSCAFPGRDGLVSWASGFDPAYASLSVAEILVHRQATAGISRGDRELTFSCRSAPPNLRLETGARGGLTVLVYHRGVRSRAYAEAERLKLLASPGVARIRDAAREPLRKASPSYFRGRAVELVSKVRRSVTDRGTKGTAERLVQQGVQRVHRVVKGRLYACDLPVPWPRARPGTTFALLGPSSFAELAAGGRYELPWIVQRYAEGTRCYGVHIDGALAVYGWEVSGRTVAVPELGGRLELTDEEVYITDCYTMPAFRGRGLYQFLLEAMLASAGDRGKTRGYGTAEEGNAPSSKGQEKAGFSLALKVDEAKWWFEADNQPPLNRRGWNPGTTTKTG